jgi:hypothetical protein
MAKFAAAAEPRRRQLEIPFEAYKRLQAAIARHKLYPLTVFYTGYAIFVLAVAGSSGQPWISVAFFSAGCVTWTLVEYLFHRYVLHGRFAPGKGFVRKFLHERLDPLHWDHHMRPLDGKHISGALKDILPLFFVAAPMSFLFPMYTAPVLLAGVVQGYVAEEWLHYALHFSNSRVALFRTTRFWDGVFETRFPEAVRRSLGKN